MDAENLVGIAGVGSYLPEKTVDAWEAVRDSGIPRDKFERIGARRLHLAAEGEKPSDMASEACRRALDDAGLAPLDVDAIIYAGSHKDHARWMASAKVQADLGCGVSFCFDLHQGCNGQNMAINVGRSLVLSDPDVHTVLLTAAERWDTTLQRPVLGHSFVFGDGASAAVLRRGHPDLVVLAFTCRTWGDHHNTFCCPELGASSKLTPEVLARGGHLFQIYRPLHTDHESIKAFGVEVNRVARELLEKACQRAGAGFSEIGVVITRISATLTFS